MTNPVNNTISMDGLQSRIESCIDQLKGHIELTKIPELCGLIKQENADQIVISTPTALDIVSVMTDCILRFSLLELDAAQDGFAAEESFLLEQRIKTLSDSQAKLLNLLKKAGDPAHGEFIKEAEQLLNEEGAQLYN